MSKQLTEWVTAQHESERCELEIGYSCMHFGVVSDECGFRNQSGEVLIAVAAVTTDRLNDGSQVSIQRETGA